MATYDVARRYQPLATSALAPRDFLASDIDGRIVVPSARSDEMFEPVRGNTTRRSSQWQIGAVVAGWPVWWAMGVTPFVFPALGVLLALRLRRRREIYLPQGFWLWVLFLLVVLLSGLAITATAPGTVTSTGPGRYLAFTLRFLNYSAITVIMIYVGNLTEKELPRLRIIRWMASLGIIAIALGTASIVFPHADFRTVMSYVLPQSFFRDGGGVAQLAQVQPVLGEGSPRPSAPFTFTNAWGNNLSLLLVWLVIAGLASRSRSRRSIVWFVLAASLVPIVYSLNRGMWIGLTMSVAVAAVRLAMRGHVAILGALSGILAVVVAVFVFSPLGTVVHQRVDTGHSNDIRGRLAVVAFDAAKSSPLVGFGSTRQVIGSDTSITTGPSAKCPKCGYQDVGSTGQLWLLLIAQGFLGAVLYVGFFLRSLWAYRLDWSPVGIAGTLVVMLEVLYGMFYSALTMPLAITMLSIALLWRNQELRRKASMAS